MRDRLLGLLLIASLGWLYAPTAFAQCPSHDEAATAAATPAQGEGHEMAAETKADVPALIEMHEVIFPLWHEAWPSKNVAMMKELLPQVEGHLQAIQQAELPGILRDKKGTWESAVASLGEDVAAYRKAAAADDTQALLDAVEALHARFESMVRIVRPVMKELDAYHVVLYQIYHKEMPEKRLEDLSTSAKALAERCRELGAAAIPARFAAKEEQLKGGFVTLCQATEELTATAVGSGADAAAVEAAVEKVHTQYQTVERMFE